MVSALSTANTLNAGDKIDGAAGNDTLNVDLQSNFSGFSSTGGLSNVETVNLTNSSTIARSFDATGVSGVTQYTLNGAISLSNLADTKAAVAINNDAKSDIIIGYAAKVTDGTTDTQAITLNNVGTAEVKDSTGTVTTAEARVAVTANGIETLALTTAGTNVVDFTDDKVTAITVTGTGSLDTKVASTVTSFDASANTGAVKVDATAMTSGKTIATGAGDDTIKADVSGLAVNATINGGAGNDTLVLKGTATSAVQYQMSGVETVSLGALGADLTFSAAKSTGITTIEASKDFTANTATFAGLGNANLAFNLKEGSAGTIAADQSGTSAVTVTASAASIANTTVQADTTALNLSNTSALNLNVGNYASYQGNITADKATSVAISGNVSNDGTANYATVHAAAATSAVLNTTGASSLTLNAAHLTDLNATVAAGTSTVPGSLDLNVTSHESTLTALESLTANVGAHSTLTVGDLAKANVVDLSGAGDVVLGKLGAEDLGYGVTVKAAGLHSLNIATATTDGILVGTGQSVSVDASTVLGDVTVGNVAVTQDSNSADTGSININVNGTAGAVTLGTLEAKNVTVDATGALKSLDVGAITVGNTLVFNGSDLFATKNTVAVTATGASLTATLNGGIGADNFTITGDSTQSQTDTLNYKVAGDLGIGANTVKIDAGSVTNTKSVTIDVSGLKVGANGSTDLIGGAGADKFIGSAGADKFEIMTNGAATAAVADVVTGFSESQGDTISFSSAVSSANFTKGTAAVADFNAALDAANAALTSTAATEVNVQQVGTDTYVFFNDGKVAGADQVVKLVGVDLAHVDFNAIA